MKKTWKTVAYSVTPLIFGMVTLNNINSYGVDSINSLLWFILFCVSLAIETVYIITMWTRKNKRN
jgi:hypothetical protein